MDLLLAAELERKAVLVHCRVGVVHGHVADEIALVTKLAPALLALVALLLGAGRDVGRVVVQVLVPLEQLLLPANTKL